MGNSAGKQRDPKGNKKGKGRHGERRLSDPGERPSTSTNLPYGLRRVGSEELTGKSYGGGEVNFSPNPVHGYAPTDVPVSSRRVSGTGALANETVHAIYQKRLLAVLAIWPELAPLEDLNFKSLRASAVEALRMLYQTLTDEHSEVEMLRRAHGEARKQITTLEKRTHGQEEELRRKLNQMAGLDREVSILTGELRRRGIEPRLLNRENHPSEVEPPSDYDIRTSKDMSPLLSSRGSIGGASGGNAEDEEEPSNMRYSKRNTTYVATPLLQASGDRQSLGDAIVKRSQSLSQTRRNSPKTGPVIVDNSRAPREMSHVVNDLTQNLRSLQHALDEEKKRSIALEKRLETVGTRGSMVSYASGSGPTPETLKERYAELEDMALSKVTTALTRLLIQQSNSELSLFICSTMLLAFEHAAEQYQRFQRALHALLTSPAATDAPSNAKPENNRKSVVNMRKTTFDNNRTSAVGSRLAQRTKATAELPHYLEEEVENFIRLSGDMVNVDQLVVIVSDSLHKEYPNCTIPAVLNLFTYNDFLHQCCRLAWQLNTMSPPCHVMADRLRYDEHHHTVLPMQGSSFPATIGAEVDYYAWPGLYRTPLGEVLCRGRVVLAM